MYFHKQNLNEKKTGKLGSIWRHGRCWFSINEKKRSCIGLEWSFLEFKFNFDLEITDEGWIFSLAIPLISLYIHLEGFELLGKISPRRKSVNSRTGEEFNLIDERECGIAIHNWAIWIKPWCKLMEWNSKDPWWVRGLTFHIDDFFLGQRKFEKTAIKEERISIPMPEGSYDAIATAEEYVRYRSYFPFFKSRELCSSIKIPKGIPFPGKGENSWDCGMDGLFGTGVNLNNIGELVSKSIGEVVENVYHSRNRYGGNGWIPSEKELNDWVTGR